MYVWAVRHEAAVINNALYDGGGGGAEIVSHETPYCYANDEVGGAVLPFCSRRQLGKVLIKILCFGLLLCLHLTHSHGLIVNM